MNLLAGFLVSLLIHSSSFGVIHGASDSKQEETQKKNKFRENEDSLLNTKCPKNLELRWQTEVSSSIYATPLIADINSDGKLEVVVPSFVHYLEVLEGTDGDKVPGWPAFHQSTVHSSPLLFDIDKDGTREIALATYNGVINFFRVSGYMMIDKLEVPRKKVHKDWYVGLYPDHTDRSHPDAHNDSLVQEASTTHSMSHGVVNENVTAGSIDSSVNTSSLSTPGTIGSFINTSSTSTGSTGSNNASTLGTTVSTSNTSKFLHQPQSSKNSRMFKSSGVNFVMYNCTCYTDIHKKEKTKGTPSASES